MPVKNAGQYLRACIQSIVEQSFTDWELLIVDDHSSDNSIGVSKEFIKADTRIRTCSNDGHGIIPALSMAFANTSGNYVTRMDADDIMPQGRLEKMVDKLEDAAPKTVVTGLVKYFADQPVSDGYLNYEKWLNEVNLKGEQWQNIYRECVIASPNWMARRSELLEINAFQESAYPEDYELVFRWYQNNFTITNINAVTLLWREHPLRTSRTSSNYNQRAFFKLKIEKFLELENRPGDVVLWGSNAKANLAAEVLRGNGVPFHWMDLAEEITRRRDQEIGHYRDIEQLDQVKLLIAVYPGATERKRLEAYLSGLGLEMGKEYWYL